MPGLNSVADAAAAEPAARDLPAGSRNRWPWVALILAAVVLLPFVQKAYTIDDPVFLREAQNVLNDPLHPSAFEMVWASSAICGRVSRRPGIATLVPLAVAGWRNGPATSSCWSTGIAIVIRLRCPAFSGLSPRAAPSLVAPVALGMTAP
jgi:hypothetical protein